ncbi:endonuclease/exonuclease/phosphatase family protein [Nonomuraea typhae]|uniref:endonuclease/exonuclease/phosphatase family protein n=1 Tax=Nonomuraea typhae TaxID=2603600 RepID=UPI001FE27B04|nr:endonuclease/exonuclease/phosphatase family protein [Nonomuraea typhae]
MKIPAESPIGGTIVTPPRRPARGRLAWVALAPFTAWAVARVAGLERGGPLTQLMTVTPYAALGSVAPLLIAALGRRRAASAVALATTATLGLCVLPRALGAASTASGRPFTVLSANLFLGRADPLALMDLVRRARPDVLSLQELTPGAVKELDAAGLAETMPHRVLRAEEGSGGTGLFSRHPVREWDVMPAGVGHQMPGAVVQVPGGRPVEIVATHPFPPAGAEVVQWRAAMAAFPPAEGLRILAGDFNATLDHAALRGVLARGYKDAADSVGAGLVPTWPANQRVPPIIAIDHVLVSAPIGVREFGVHTVPGTDHRAVVARLVLPE